MLDYAQARQLMVDGQLRTFDVNDVAVLDAFSDVERERFVAPGREEFAYIDQSLRLPSADGDPRVLPAPMVLARMIQALKVRPGMRALDVAAGYGYGSALLARLGARVVALETDSTLAAGARERLGGRSGVAQAGSAVEVIEGPLAEGAASLAPYDVILVEGRIEVKPQTLLDQLGDGGRLVAVLGSDRGAKATLFVRAGDAFGSRPLFDATLQALEAFAAKRDFAF